MSSDIHDDIQIINSKLGDTVGFGNNKICTTDESGLFKLEERRSSFIPRSGRFYCYTNNRWVTDSDDNYGTNYYQMNENCQTGPDPLIEWEHLGTVLPSGCTIKALHMIGRVNSNQVTDMEYFIVKRTPNPITRYGTGFDNDGEMTNTLITRGFWKSSIPGYAGNMNDRHGMTLNLDFDVNELSQISIYIRPVGTLTGNRYFTASWTWEIK